jgi:beta-glucanase (GH16 family)
MRLTQKRALFAGLLGCFLLSGLGWATPPKEKRWVLTFQDEFQNSTLDTSHWNTSFKGGRRAPRPGSKELQYYAEDAFLIKDGILSIRAEKKPIEGLSYSSGLLTTYDKFDQQYGYFEMRAKLPAGKGMFPAFWLYAVQPGFPDEVDIMEMVGYDTKTVHFTNHFWQPTVPGKQSGRYTGPDFSAGFHTFGLYWDESVLIWCVDDVPRFVSSQGVPKRPLFMLLNLAIGGDWPGNPDVTTRFPASYQIDYVRVYRQE